MKSIYFFILILLISCVTKTKKTDEGIEYKDLIVNENTDTIKSGSAVKFHIRGFIIESDEKNFDLWGSDSIYKSIKFLDTYEKNLPFELTLGYREEIFPFTIQNAIISSSIKNKRILIVPLFLAKGLNLNGKKTELNSIIKLEIEIIEKPLLPEINIKKHISLDKQIKIEKDHLVTTHYKIYQIIGLDSLVTADSKSNSGNPPRFYYGDRFLEYYFKQAFSFSYVNDYLEFEVPEYNALQQKKLFVKLTILGSYKAIFTNPWEFDTEPTLVTPSGYKYKIYQYGDGNKIKSKDIINIHYSIYNSMNKYIFSTKETNEPFSFIVDSTESFKALSEFIKVSSNQEKSRLYLNKTDLNSEIIKSFGIKDANIFLEIEILSVKKRNINETL